MLKKIYIVLSYNDGPLAAYYSESGALHAKDEYGITGLYPQEEIYVEECFLVEDD